MDVRPLFEVLLVVCMFGMMVYEIVLQCTKSGVERQKSKKGG